MKSPVKVRFWGTRGSLAKPGRNTERYGGNTSCVHITSPAGSSVVIDCGTGVNDLGHSLLAGATGPLKGSILISHTHWDHIQGFPFFAPLFVPGGEWDIYGPAGLGQSLKGTLAGQMQHTYFPVELEQMGAKLRFHDLVEGYFEIDDIQITTRYLNHPALTLGYRLEMGNVCVVYACDHEPHSRIPGHKADEHELDREHAEFLADADLVIHDAQFTDKEYPNRKGWGHSPVEYVSEVGQISRVKRMALSHHDPQRSDDALDNIIEELRTDLINKSSPMHIFGATEGLLVELDASAEGAHHHTSPFSAMSEPSAIKDSWVLMGVSEAGLALSLSEALRSADIQTTQTSDAAATLKAAKSSQPSLIILEDNPTGIDGLKLCHQLRMSGEAYLKDVPIVLVGSVEKNKEGHEAGVTQWLVSPFSTQFARAQIQAMLLRSTLRWKRAPLPPDETKRLGKLRGLALLDTAPEERFDRITRLAGAIGDVPLALITLVDEHRQWFKSCLGPCISETSREVSFCAHTILDDAPLIVPDTLLDDRFADNPLVVGEHRIRFYAGFPVIDAHGVCLGTLCLIDTRPRNFSEQTVRLLHDLACIVEDEISATPEPS